MKNLFIATALVMGLFTTAATAEAHERVIVERGLSVTAFKNSVQRWSVYDGTDWVPGLIVRSHATPTKYVAGMNGLTEAIINDPGLAAAWARGVAGNPYLQPIGKTTDTTRVTPVKLGPDLVSTTTRTTW